MKKELLRQIIINRTAKSDSKDIDSLIADFLRKNGKKSRKQMSDVISRLQLHVLDRYGRLPKKDILESAKNMLESDLHIQLDTGLLEAVYIKTAKGFAAENGLGAFVFNTLDEQTLSAMRKNFFWLQSNHSKDVRDRLYNTIKLAFDGDVDRLDLPGILQNEFGSCLAQETRYFKDVSDHIISQGQNLARVNQGKKYDVKNYQVKAVIDRRTSRICRSMNGRIIPAAHLESQCADIQSAKDINEKKKAAPWRNEPFLGKSRKLDTNFGLPPYHFRCRTILQPVWVRDEEVTVRGEKVMIKNTGKPLKKGELFRHIDNTGVERVVTGDTYGHKSRSEKPSAEKLVYALNSISGMGEHSKKPGRFTAWSQNGYFMSFEGDHVITAFKPERGIRYFRANTMPATREVIKWQESLISRLLKAMTGQS